MIKKITTEDINNFLTEKPRYFYNYKTNYDLIKKIKYYSQHDNARKKIAKLGYMKYHKYMSNIIITKYIMSCIGLENNKKPFWHSY